MGSDLSTTLSNLTNGASAATKGLGAVAALTQGASAVGSVVAGSQKNTADLQEAKAQNLQAQAAENDAQLNAAQQARTTQQTAASQTVAYLANGVSVQGSPMAIIGDTLNQGQIEINATLKHGNLLKQLYNMKAQQYQQAGRSALLGGAGQAATGLTNAGVQASRLGLFKGAAPSSPSSTVQDFAPSTDLTPSGSVSDDISSMYNIPNYTGM